jgi:NADH:ubiquinone oxidoreductase subunit E
MPRRKSQTLIAQTPLHELVVFVCTKSNCAEKGAEELRGELKKRVANAGLAHRVRVTASGCLDRCEAAVNVYFSPAHTVMCHAGKRDVDALMGEILARLAELSGDQPCQNADAG